MHFTSRVIPKAPPTPAISTSNPVTTGTSIEFYRIPTRIVATELLLTILAEAVSSSVYDNLIVAALKADRFS